VIFQPWLYVVVVIVIMAFFCLGIVAHRIKNWWANRRMARKIATSYPPPPSRPTIPPVDAEKLSKYIGQGHSFDESLRYAKTQCASYRGWIDHFDDVYLALK
jgi:hypothetical protein